MAASPTRLRMPDDLPLICETFGLGRLVAPPVTVKPGSVPVFRARTERGDFHVKVWLAGEWDWLQSYVAGCAEVETSATAVGVEMAQPIVLNQRFGASIVAVHRWHEGRPVLARDDIAGWLGHTLTRLHTIPPPPSAPADSIDTWYGVHPADDWQSWIDEAAEKSLPWAAAGRTSLPAILAAAELVNEGLSAGGRIVGSHRDLLGGNILNDRGSYRLIDWDCAGPEVAWLETVRAAIEFGRLAGGDGDDKPLNPVPEVMGGILTAYLRAGGEADVHGRGAIAGTLGLALSRLAWSMWQSLGHRERTEEELATATAYVSGAFAKIERRLAAIDDMTAIIARYAGR